MPETERDPYSQVIDAIWAVLENEPAFTDLVSVSNRVKYTGQRRAPVLDNLTEANTPEVRIISTGTTPLAIHTSDHSSETLSLSVQVSSGDQRLDYRHFPVKWAIWRALIKEAHTKAILSGLKWKGQPFVVDVILHTASDGVSESDLERGIKGWSQVWAFDILMAFQHRAL